MGPISRKKVLVAIGSLIILFFLFSAVRIGTADLLSKYLKNEIEDLSTSTASPDVSAIESLNRVLSVARFISPEDPDHLEDLAHLALSYATLPGLDAAKRAAQLSKGIEHIHDAIALRPVSAYAWASLLLLKREQGSYDAEFRHALERTVTLGPWETELQPIVADVGLSAWAALPLAEQEMVRENFVRGMKRQPDVMIAISQSHQDDCKGEQAAINAACTK
jgi:hypothetical protein